MLNGERQQILDAEHLRLLRIGYFVFAGTAAFTGGFGLLYLIMGLVFAATFSSMPHTSQAPPAFMPWLFVGIGGLITVAAGAYTALALLTARALRSHRSRKLCLITAGLSCLYIPFGTVLGIFTFSVLARPSVHALFEPVVPPRLFPMPPPPPVPSSSGGTVA